MATLTQLEYLVAVDRLRHFGRAAKACHVSQPTLSMQLRKLEDEYGVTFFDRTKSPILPTAEAVPLIDQARQVLREMGKLDHLSQQSGKELSGEFRLALIPTIAPDLLPLFLGAFAKRYPRVELSIHERTTENIIEGLRHDKIDAGILATPLGIDGFTERPLYYEPFWLYVSADHPLAKHDRVHEDRLEAKDIWLLEEGHCLRNQIIRVCSLKGRPGTFSNVRFESGSLSTVAHLVEQGHGYTLLPYLTSRSLPASKKGLLRPFTKPAPSREVSLVFQRSQYKRGILDAVFGEIQKALPPELPREKGKEIEVIRI